MTPSKFLTIFALTAAVGCGFTPSWASPQNKSQSVEQATKSEASEPLFISFDLLSGNSLHANLSKLEIKDTELLSDLLSAYGLVQLIRQDKLDASQEVEISSSPTKSVALRLDPAKKIKVKELVTALLFLKSPDARLTLHKLLAEHYRDGNIKISNNGSFNLNSSEITCSADDLIEALSMIFAEFEKMGINPFKDQFCIGGTNYPSQLKASRSPKTEIIMLIDKDQKAILSLARVDHPNKKSSKKEHGSLLLNTEPPLPTGELIQHSSKMLSEAANNFETFKIIPKGKIISTVDLKGSEKKQLVMIAPEDIFISLKKNDLQQRKHNKVELLIERDDPIKLPIISGSQIGTLKIVFNGQTLKNVPLTANENVYPSFKQKVLDKLNSIID